MSDRDFVRVGVEEHAAFLMDSVLATANLEAMKVHVLPAERDLQDLVKPGDARIASQQKSPPDQRADAAQHCAQLQDLLSRRCSGFHLQTYFAAPHTPRIVMLSMDDASSGHGLGIPSVPDLRSFDLSDRPP